MTQHDQAQQAAILYAEDHSAIRWPYFLHIALWAFPLFSSIAAIMWSWNPSMSPSLLLSWGLPLSCGLIGVLTMVFVTIIAWPTGIQVRSNGLLVGGIHRTHRRDRHLPSANGRWKRPFFCPWSAIRSAQIVTGHAHIRRMHKELRAPGRVMLGMFWAPFMRSALFLEIDTKAVTIPEFRPADDPWPPWRGPLFRPASFAVPFTSPVWVIPTKRPEALRAALAQHVNLQPLVALRLLRTRVRRQRPDEGR